MKNTYSIYEAKAKLSEIIRAVKSRRRVTITERGVAVAQVVPYQPRQEKLAERLTQLEAEGVLIPAKRGPDAIRPIGKRPGALDRFLRDRE